MAKKITDDGEIIDTVTYETVAMAPPFFKTPWNHDTNLESKAAGQLNLEPSMTQQQFAKDADINVILAKFMKTGDPALLNPSGSPRYLDIEESLDLQDTMVTSDQVNTAWLNLPAQARAILQTPARFLEWYDHCLETGNIQGLRDIGLVPPEKAQEPPKPPASPGGDSSPPKAEKAPPEPKKAD